MRGRAFTITIVVFLLATALRLAFVAQYRANPLFDRPIIDALTYHEWAIRIARGDGLGEGAFTRAPLYPIFLAGVYKLSGIGPNTPPLELMPGAPPASQAIRNAKMAQAILGGASAALLAAAGLALYGPFVGAAAGVFFALHPLLIFYTGELFGETLAIFLTLVGFCALALARRRAAAALHLLAGIALGLSAITRPTILMVVLPLPLVLLAIDWLERRRASSLLGAAALALGLAVAIAPVTIRNAREGGGLVLVSSQGGVNLWMGNNADADGRSARSPGRGRTATPAPVADIIDVAARQIAEQETGRALTAAEVSDHWGAKAKRWIASHPLDFLRLSLRKLYFFFGGAEIWDQQCDVDFLARFSPIVSVLLVAQPVSLPAGFVMPLALIGLFLVARDAVARATSRAPARTRADAATPAEASSVTNGAAGPLLLLWFFLPYLAGVLLFFVASRYRLPLLPFLFLFAAIALERLIDLWRSGPPRRALLHTLPLLAAAVLLNLHARYANPLYQSRARVFVANALIDSGATERALPYLEEAMRIEPQAADPHYALGIVRLSQDDPAGARREFEETLARDPGFERAAINLANLHAQAGEWEEALALYERALEVMPADGMILDNLAIVAREAGSRGRADLAERALRRILAERPDDVDAMNALAWNLADRLGRPGEAVPIAHEALGRAREPGKIAEIEDTLGWALFLAGDAAGALPHLRAARAALPGNADVALHLGLALLAANPSRATEVEAEALLDESFAAPGGDARRARADAIIKNL